VSSSSCSTSFGMFLIVESKIDDDAEIRCSIFSYSRAQSFLQKISKAVLSDNQNPWKFQ
jgi:hypothetical protein